MPMLCVADEIEKNGEFATRVVAIETDCPLDETVTAIVKTVWTAL